MKKKNYTFDIVVTKGGDTGKSSLYSGEFLFKNDFVFETIGSIDESSSYLGICIHHVPESLKDLRAFLKNIQTKMYNAMSVLATKVQSPLFQEIPKIEEKDVLEIEKRIDKMLKKIAIEQKFVLPGEENLISAHCDYVRTLIRKNERNIVELIQKTGEREYIIVQKYFNRLSDFFFVLARFLGK